MNKDIQNQHINGFDRIRLQETIESIQDSPTLSKSTYSACNSWIKGGQCKTTIRNYYTLGKRDQFRTGNLIIQTDEPPVLLGKNSGPCPVELALCALASCMTSSLVFYSTLRNIQLEKVNALIEGDIDLHGFLGLSPKVRSGFEIIRMQLQIQTKAPRKTILEICHLVQQQSPVLNMFTIPVPISIDAEII